MRTGRFFAKAGLAQPLLYALQIVDPRNLISTSSAMGSVYQPKLVASLNDCPSHARVAYNS